MLTQRQEKILESLIREYIERARPVGSEVLEKRYRFGLSPATIRNEMQELTQQGFIFQPHISAGRVPTDKGYRFFVDKLLEPGFDENLSIAGDVRGLTKFLASESFNLALGYLFAEKILWKEGWRWVLSEPEFAQTGLAAKLAKVIDEFEENIEDFFLPEIKVYIGRENPVSKIQDFSLITLGCSQGLLAILGPKRMNYDRNIKLICSLCRKI